jgi:hypothetical protein
MNFGNLTHIFDSVSSRAGAVNGASIVPPPSQDNTFLNLSVVEESVEAVSGESITIVNSGLYLCNCNSPLLTFFEILFHL